MATPTNSTPVSEAAARLGVSERRVRAMIDSGRLPAEKVAGVWWIPQSAVAARARSGSRSGRSLSPDNAWAALLLASGETEVPWLSRQARWRLSSVLRDQGVKGLVGRLGARGWTRAYNGHPGEFRYPGERSELMLTGASAAEAHRLDLHGGESLDAYVSSGSLARIVDEHALEEVPLGEPGNVVLREVASGLWERVGRRVAPLAAVLVDLSESDDPRSRRVGTHGLKDLDERS
jgi:excisionase family DNA binding protein